MKKLKAAMVAAVLFLATLSISIPAADIKKNVNGGATVTMSKAEFEACKAEGGCVIASGKTINDLVEKIRSECPANFDAPKPDTGKKDI